MLAPSIFNDVIGPVMRGPSSSHCAASLRIGRICRDLMGGNIQSALIKYDPDGSLATTHKSQGSDMGLFSGFLGWEADDERLPNYQTAIEESGIKTEIVIQNIQADHPNTYQINLLNSHSGHKVVALSTGGGVIEIISVDELEISYLGDNDALFIFGRDLDSHLTDICSIVGESQILDSGSSDKVVFLTLANSLPDEIKQRLLDCQFIKSVSTIKAVMPVKTPGNLKVPFLTVEEMLKFNADKNLPLWSLALEYEAARGGISCAEVLNRAEGILGIMRNAVEQGLKGTEYQDRILGSQSPEFKNLLEKQKLIPGDCLNRIILSVSAIMEVKSSMGVIVAAPTAGSCGAMPGALIGVADSMGEPEDVLVKAMLTAGLIGVFIAAHATFAAEMGGCQAECGSGSGMASAAIVQMAGGSLEQSLTAASMALQNSFGMVCDPIANRVEAPCLGKNVMAASNALACANMALSGYDPLIPLDEVIDAMSSVGESLPHELRCTALGGLSVTPTAKKIAAELEEGQHQGRIRFKSC